MTVITVTDLHTVPDPERHLAIKAASARAQAGTTATRLIVRVPDRASDGIRAYRTEDIARMLQKHARIREIAVTDKGTIVAAGDVCDRRGEIAVWTGQAIGPWDPSDITQRGLGGSETAAVRLSEQLAAMGYIVTLYGDFADDGMAGDVRLRHYARYDASEPLDAFVCFRDARQLDQRPNAQAVILWLEDLAPAEQLTPARAANIDRVVTVSRFHRDQVLETHPWLDPDQVMASRNGIMPDWFTDEPAPDREHRVVYSSSPDRGGDIILELWPQVRERVPDAELVLTYSRWWDLVVASGHWPSATAHRDRLYGLLAQPGVHRIEGGLGQKALANLLRSSRVWAHPSWYSAGANPDGQPGGIEFHETNCIACQEAQAAGCAVVASNWGALSEFVFHGTLIDGDPRELEGSWRTAFVDAIVKGLTDESVQAMAETLGPEYVKGLDWRGAAEQLASLFPARVKAGL